MCSFLKKKKNEEQRDPPKTRVFLLWKKSTIPGRTEAQIQAA